MPSSSRDSVDQRRHLERELGKAQSQHSDVTGALASRRARWLGDTKRR